MRFSMNLTISLLVPANKVTAEDAMAIEAVVESINTHQDQPRLLEVAFRTLKSFLGNGMLNTPSIIEILAEAPPTDSFNSL